MFRQQQRAKSFYVGIAQQLDQVILPFDVMDPKNMGDRQRGLVRSVAHPDPRPGGRTIRLRNAFGSSGSSARRSFARFRLVVLTTADFAAGGAGAAGTSSLAGGGVGSGSSPGGIANPCAPPRFGRFIEGTIVP
jgi:hypothetical protein